MTSASRISIAIGLLSMLGAPPGDAQNVQYSGTLRIGYSDADNTPAVLPSLDSGWPRCDVLPHDPAGTMSQTLGTLRVNGRATQVGTGPGAELVFAAVGAGQGGAQVIERERCRVSLSAPTALYRSRTTSTHLRWPANVGAYADSHTVLSSPASPTATYRLSAGGGLPYSGATLMTPHPLGLVVGGAQMSQTKGANHFGGGAPVGFHRRMRAGVHTIPTLATFPPPPYDYGSFSYYGGTIDLWPLPIGDAGRRTLFIPTVGGMVSNPAGMIVSRPDFHLPSLTPGVNEWVARTPGGSTQDQHGAILTVGGGNTVTPAGTWMQGPQTLDCVTGQPVPCPAIQEIVRHVATLQAWTTGRVRVSNMNGVYTTVRSASGFDLATVGPNGTTRRIQLVSPFTTAFLPTGQFGLAAPFDVLSGVAELTLNVIPVPEPATTAMLVGGALASILARRLRRGRG